MSYMRNKILVAGLVAALMACAAASADPPERVGRLNLIQGSVSFKPGSMEEWTAATLNYPLTAGDSLWTEASSRAEVHVGSTAIRLAEKTEFGLLDLDDQRVQISLPQGLLNVRLRELEADESFEVDTPTMSVSLTGVGSYRIEVDDSGNTQATVNEGEMEVVVERLTYPIRAHQTALVAQSDSPAIEIRKAPAQDEWDRWCANRDSREDHLASVQYVPRTMIGCEDLDWYGSWNVIVGYGPVWTPRSLPSGWAPYRFGHWAWVGPWGWTWIDDMPWGFAPFHYGRWALVRGAWVWVPGANAHRPVYAPALVVFIEGGAVANGRIGWFPLGPAEPYVPPYAVSRAYLQRVNITQVKIGDHEAIDASRIQYANRNVSNAYTVVPQQSFSQARRVGDSRVVLHDKELSQVRVIGNTARVAPQRESVLATSQERQHAVAGPPENAKKQRVIVRDAPTSYRTPFAEEQKELSEHPGKPVEPKKQQAQREKAAGGVQWIKQPSPREQGTMQRTPQARQSADVQAQEPQARQSPKVQVQEPQTRQSPKVQAPEPKVKQSPQLKTQQPQGSKTRQKVRVKKQLPNGQWIWVEEWDEP
jgi:hypothetical protein